MKRHGNMTENGVQIYGTDLANKPSPWKPVHNNEIWISENNNCLNEG